MTDFYCNTCRKEKKAEDFGRLRVNNRKECKTCADAIESHHRKRMANHRAAMAKAAK